MFKILAAVGLFAVNSILCAQQARRGPESSSAAESPLTFFLQGRFEPNWQDSKALPSPTDPAQTVQVPHFSGCQFDVMWPTLPYFQVVANLPAGIQLGADGITGQYSEEASLVYESWVRSLGPEAFNNADWHPENPVVVEAPAFFRGQPMQSIRIYPVQVHRSGRLVRKHTRITWNPIQGVMRTPAPQARTASSSSVLAQGAWYKIPIGASGVYRLDRQALQSMGINADVLDPRTIRIFGNGGGMVPQANSRFRYDDLAENPILVTGEGDGQFDAEDQIVFYAGGPHAQLYNPTLGTFRQENHIYADTIYYFLNVGLSPGLRVQQAGSLGPAITVTSTPMAQTFATDRENLQGWGQMWFMDRLEFETQKTYTFNLPALQPGTNIRLDARVASRAGSASSFAFRQNGQNVSTVTIAGLNLTNFVGAFANLGSASATFGSSALGGQPLALTVEYTKGISGIGWVDFITVNYRQLLQASGGPMLLYAEPTSGSAPQQLQIQNGAGYEVWDVTHPHAIRRLFAQTQGNTLLVDAPGDTLRTLVAFPSAALGSLARAAGEGAVPNQDLHGLGPADYIIATHPSFEAAAQTLAQFHRQQYNRRVHVATTTQIYNEFSSGAQDVSGIRDFVKMLYDRATTAADRPQFLCLLGDGSFDFRDIGANSSGQSFVPFHQARQSLRPPSAFGSDDIYGFMDENEGNWGENSQIDGDFAVENHVLDIAVGRLPARTPEEASGMVQKTIQYVRGPGAYGDWRSQLMFAADYKPQEGFHMEQADQLASRVEAVQPCFRFNKLYLAAFPKVSMAQGDAYPEARDEFLRHLDRGTLLVNYTGHGAETSLSSAQIITVADVGNLANADKPSVWVTASCEFGRFDDPRRQCGGEALVQRAGHGAVGVITAVRMVYVSANDAINNRLIDNMFTYDAALGRHRTLGEAVMLSKNQVINTNSRNFVLLGDPGITLGIPSNNVVITELNNQAFTATPPDTLRALSNVRLRGEVRRADGTLRQDFNGEMTVTVLDKPLNQTTMQGGFQFENQRVVLFNGLVSVTNGVFSLQFVVPLDISYEVGMGKLIFYADAENVDAMGCTREVVICCTDSNAAANASPPVVNLYINNTDWISGSHTNQAPTLLALCADDQGINTTGLGVGRELTAFLNGDEANPIILNDFYQAKKDVSNQGTVRYQLRELPPGSYNLRIRVWDVSNNSASDETEFIVADDADLALENVLNYPNPFTTNTNFFFNHNRVGEEVDAQIRIYTVSGRMVKFLRSQFVADGNLCNHIEWDGLDDFGDKIGRGVYVYEVKLIVRRTGETATEFQKLVLLR